MMPSDLERTPPTSILPTAVTFAISAPSVILLRVLMLGNRLKPQAQLAITIPRMMTLSQDGVHCASATLFCTLSAVSVNHLLGFPSSSSEKGFALCRLLPLPHA